MRSRTVLKIALFLSPILGYAGSAVSSKGLAYTVGANYYEIYSVNPNTGAYEVFTTIVDTALGDIAVLNSQTAYALGYSSSDIYSVNLSTGSYKTITTSPIGGITDNLYSMSLANSNTAYVVGYSDDKIYSVNLTTGTWSTLTTIAGGPHLSGICVANTSTAYVTGSSSGNIYAVNLQTGAYTTVTLTPSLASQDIYGIVLADFSTAYVTGQTQGTVYKVNLQTGAYTLVESGIGSIGDVDLINIGLKNGTTALSVGYESNDVYSINLVNGSYYVLAGISGTPGLSGISLQLQMATSGLNGNDLSLANYLNANGTIDLIREFALLGNNFESAIRSATPTRNALVTYASQNAYLAAAQAMCDHGRQKRFHYQPLTERARMAAADVPVEELLASRSNEAQPHGSGCKRDRCTVWLTPFGEYAREGAQNQTPSFTMGLGGGLAAVEYNGVKNDVVGIGGAYAFTHIHEDQGLGSANINQGFLTLYGTLRAEPGFYLDLGVWGGYYGANNQRKISFPGVNATSQSHIHGWQAAPHLEVGYEGFQLETCGVKWFGIEPFLMGDWVANWERDFEERGAGKLNVGQKGRFCSLLRCEAGFRFHQIVRFERGLLVFREKESYAYQKAFHTGHITAFLIGTPGTFTVDTLTTAQNLGVVELSMLFAPTNTKAPYIDLRCQCEFGSKYQSYQGMIEIGKSF